MPLELLTLILKDQLFSEFNSGNSEHGIKAQQYSQHTTMQRFQYQM